MSLKMLKRLTKTIKTTRWTVKNADRNSFCWTIQRYCEALEEFVLRGRFKKEEDSNCSLGDSTNALCRKI